MTTAIHNQTMRSIGALVASVAAIGCSESEARPGTVEREASAPPVEQREPTPDSPEPRPSMAGAVDPGPVRAQGPESERVLAAAAVGGTTGRSIAERMDGLAQTLQGELEGADVARVSEGIIVTIGVGILFDEGSDDIAPAALDYLARFANQLVAAPRMDLTVIGHTDRLGSPADNLALSEERARAAADILRDQGIEPSRIATVGRGESEPVALDDATSDESARLNRRIEIAIYAGEAMKRELSAPMEDE